MRQRCIPMADRYKSIQVYSHWEGMEDPILMGELSASEVRGKEVFSFTYDNGWLQTQGRSILDPALHFYSGPQYLYDEKPNFGVFTDSSPDRWGRMLIKRREALRARIKVMLPILVYGRCLPSIWQKNAGSGCPKVDATPLQAPITPF